MSARRPAARHCVVALTGGVAAGKSAVARRFEARGIAVYDADAGAREVVAAGTPALGEIRAAFGDGVLDAEGSLDRRAMRARVFADGHARATLEAIIHPRVHTWLREKVAADRGPYCLLAIPLLVENRAEYAWVDRVLLVDAPEERQVERLLRRDRTTPEHARQMLAAQSTREQRLAIADDVIVNDGSEAALDAQVAVLHARYLELARGSQVD